MHEAQSWERNCFITLTYAEGKLPEHGFLNYTDFQLFMKRLRKAKGANKENPIRFYMCGEYGEKGGRPHYHACMFNLDFDDREPIGKSKAGFVFDTSKELEAIWGMGHVTVQPLIKETASYCARYIMKKVFGDDAEKAYEYITAEGEILRRPPEFANMSLRPGVGGDWIDKYSGDVYPLDAVVADGQKRAVPKFYDRRVKRSGQDFDEIAFKREKRARAKHADNTDDRLRVREAVHQAKVQNLKRDLT